MCVCFTCKTETVRALARVVLCLCGRMLAYGSRTDKPFRTKPDMLGVRVPVIVGPVVQ
jgi:hypothetical protein